MMTPRAMALGGALAIGAVAATTLIASFAPPFTSDQPTPDPLSIDRLFVDIASVSAELDVAGDAGVSGNLYCGSNITVSAGNSLCVNKLCGSRVYENVANRLVIQGVAGTTNIDGFIAQGTVEAGELQANSVELVGGATSATVRAASGTGATPDAGLYLQGGLPNGPVVATNDAGFWARAVRYQPWTLAAAPPCGAGNAGEMITVLWPSGLSDGGFDAQAQVCDGEHWIQSRFLLGLSSDAKAGSGLFWRLDAAYTGEVTSIPGSVDTPGNGAQPVEYLLRQGAKVLCRGGLPSCAVPAGTAFRLSCGPTPATFTVSPDGGLAYALIAEVDAGCAQTPGVAFEADVRRFGYPDPGWSPP